MTIAGHALSMLVALGLDAAIGWPDRLYARVGHPVSWLGRLIGAGDHAWNREEQSFASRRAFGAALALGIIALATSTGAALAWALPGGWWGAIGAGIVAWPLVAARALHTHVAAVARPLCAGDLSGARHAVSMIVGRDPDRLDHAGIARAAAESLAENTSDGVIAPLFWGVMLGLPGIAAYKAINTLDSMIAYRSARYLAFGWAAARIDDIANLIPARLTGLIYALVSARPIVSMAVMFADARHHRSPNAGWPEAAFAGALGIRLSGPRHYDAGVSEDAYLNAAAPDPLGADLARGLALFRRVCVMAAAALVAIALTGGQ